MGIRELIYILMGSGLYLLTIALVYRYLFRKHVVKDIYSRSLRLGCILEQTMKKEMVRDIVKEEFERIINQNQENNIVEKLNEIKDIWGLHKLVDSLKVFREKMIRDGKRKLN